MRTTLLRTLFHGGLLTGALSLAACAAEVAGPEGTEPRGAKADGEGTRGPSTDADCFDPFDPDCAPALESIESIRQDAPADPEVVRKESRSPLPEAFDLLESEDDTPLQTPVQNQARRGVCSIFSTVGYMEHLYLAAGQRWDGEFPAGAADKLTMPDFSEQFLQWSVKMEMERFPDSEGSNAGYNLGAISTMGLVPEQAWPYEKTGWDESDDERCDGSDDQPTICYTNGEPPESAMDPQLRWMLPESGWFGRWISTQPSSIKSHMHNTKTGVVVGLEFFYQAWNHGGAARLDPPLPIDRELGGKGIVLAPNETDVERSRQKGSGHSILLIGWDDTMEAQARDAEGNPMVDEDGDPVMQKGFFLFKNSWGTGSFGTSHRDRRIPDGYGWISYDYVAEFGNGSIAKLPTAGDFPEQCGDDVDNNGDGLIDCEDPVCADTAACEPAVEVCDDGMDNDGDGLEDCDDADCELEDHCAPAERRFENREAQAIEDHETITSTIEVPAGAGVVEGLGIGVDIEHSWRGDLVVTLSKEGSDTVTTLWDREGNSSNDLKETFSARGAFDGQEAAGTWILSVTDEASQDQGQLNGWSLELGPFPQHR
jgi:hypothetical protein